MIQQPKAKKRITNPNKSLNPIKPKPLQSKKTWRPTKPVKKLPPSERIAGNARTVLKAKDKTINEAYDRGFNDGYAKGLEDGGLDESN